MSFFYLYLPGTFKKIGIELILSNFDWKSTLKN